MVWERLGDGVYIVSAAQGLRLATIEGPVLYNPALLGEEYSSCMSRTHTGVGLRTRYPWP